MIEDYKIAICNQHSFNLSLFIYYCGSKVCKEEYWSPLYNDNFMLFYVFSGDGKVEIEGKEYDVKENQGFLLYPKSKVTFHSIDKPCEIAWIGFYGFLASRYLQRAGLSSESPIYKDDEEQGIGKTFLSILEDSKLEHNRYCKITASLYIILSKLLDIYDTTYLDLYKSNHIENYIRKALQYIDMHFSEKISIQQLADYVGIDRKYLHYIFKKKLDIGPQQYLIIYRMYRACTLLQDKDLSIAEIAKIVGYENPLNFSGMFKKTIGISPKEYRKNPIFIRYNVLNWDR